MQNPKLFTEAFAFIRQQEFVTIGTANLNNRPHTSLKMVLSAQGRELVLVEYRLGRSYRNLKENPLISISTFDIHRHAGLSYLWPLHPDAPVRPAARGMC